MNRIIEPLIAGVGIIAPLLLLVAALGYQNETFALGEAFDMLRAAAYTGISATGLIIFYVLWRRPQGLRLGVLFAAGILGLIAFYFPYRQQQIASQVPPIHDITTDINNPPAFVAVAPLRADAPNPVEYAGEETAALQREAYPDIRTMAYPVEVDEVFAEALAVAENMGWEVVAVEEAEGRIEATATTRWFRFKDDVVIRVQPGTGGMTLVDMRSKSRVGRSDIGVNAARIRAFREALNARLQNP